MTERVAIYCTSRELAAGFGGELPPESLCIPTYNLAPPGALLVIGREDGRQTTERVPWQHPTEKRHSLAIDRLPEVCTPSAVRTVVLPISGFYLWKRGGEQAEHPFYVRPQREDFFLLGGILFQSSSRDESTGVLPVHQPANALIRPLDEEMPWCVPKEKLDHWLQGKWAPDSGGEQSFPGLGITEMTVHRVGTQVNELDRNGKELIQPLPR